MTHSDRRRNVLSVALLLIGSFVSLYLLHGASRFPVTTTVFSMPTDSLLSQPDTVFRIVHIGDSHVQAGYFSDPVRCMTESLYPGTKGYGWINLHRLYGSNESENYRVDAHPARWQIQSLLRRDIGEPIGPGGLLLSPNASRVECNIALRSGRMFDRLLVFRTPAAPSLLPENAAYVLRRDTMANPSGLEVDTLLFPSAITRVKLQASAVSLTTAGYAGFVAELSTDGMRFDEVGNNGATFSHYATKAYISALAQLNPNMLLVSLGTNESLGRGFDREAFMATLDRFSRLVRAYMPGVCIVFTTPPPNFKPYRIKTGTVRRKVRNRRGKRVYKNVPVYTTGHRFNPNVRQVVEALRTYAEREGYNCIDLYNLMGGETGGEQWVSQGLYARDRIHFSVAGYRKQGELVAQALRKML